MRFAVLLGMLVPVPSIRHTSFSEGRSIETPASGVA